MYEVGCHRLWRDLVRDMKIKGKKKNKPRIVVGVAWYRPEQWQRLREISVDVDDLENTYEEWLHSAEENLKEIKVPNLELRKADVDTEELLSWSNERGYPVNAQARSEFVTEKVRNLDEERAH